MALVRILVDGQSLLNAANPPSDTRSRRSSAALDELLHRLTSYQDACGTPISVVFDASSDAPDSSVHAAFEELDLHLARPGQKVSQLLMRLAHKWGPQGDVLVVTNDWSQGTTLPSLGGKICSCSEFLRQLSQCLDELEQEITRHNQREDQKFTDHG